MSTTTYVFVETLFLFLNVMIFSLFFHKNVCAVNVLIFWTPKCLTYANSADPDQTAPEGAVCSGSTLFAIPQSILRHSCIKRTI